MASCKGRVCLGRENICKNCIKEDVCKVAEDFYKEPVFDFRRRSRTGTKGE